MRRTRFSMFILLLLSVGAKADNFCFASAETYYEQVYCQLQAKAQLKNLPSLHQFKKNNEQVQYSLLKRPAERNAIKFPPPIRKVAQSASEPKVPSSSRDISELPTAFLRNIPTDVVTLSQPDSLCELGKRQIRCLDSVYELSGNKANHRLAANVLDSGNTMGLPKVGAGAASLAAAYERYIGKMCDIGLCGVTMTYRKFAYLYQDLQTKGLDFSQRFETMFSFLKKDKAAMAVSEAINLPTGVSLADCGAMGSRFYVCGYQGRNYIFELQ